MRLIVLQTPLCLALRVQPSAVSSSQLALIIITTTTNHHLLHCNPGLSNCELEHNNEEGHAVWSGNLSTEIPTDSRVTRSGYCNLRSIAAMYTQHSALILTLPLTHFRHCNL